MNHCWDNTTLCLRQSCAEVLSFSLSLRKPVQRSQVLANLTIEYVKSRSILNAPPELLVLSGSPENALAESEGTMFSSRGAWEHLELRGSTGAVYGSVWELCAWLPDRFTLC
jgi:hypothetical protein